jgi:hypothetical protein
LRDSLTLAVPAVSKAHFWHETPIRPEYAAGEGIKHGKARSSHSTTKITTTPLMDGLILLSRECGERPQHDANGHQRDDNGIKRHGFPLRLRAMGP